LSIKPVNGYIRIVLILLTGMNKPTGGRGKKAPYETTHVRVPTEIKTQVEQLIEAYRSRLLDIPENSLTSNIDNPLTGLEDATLEARKILVQKKSARISLEKLLTAIYGTKVSL